MVLNTSMRAQQGVTLIELMITVAIIGVISAIALPIYQDYVVAARTGVVETNIQTIRLLQDERRRSFGEFAEGVYVPGGTNSLTPSLGWSPNTADDVISYTVTCATDGSKAGECARNSGYTIVGSHALAPTETVTRSYVP